MSSPDWGRQIVFDSVVIIVCAVVVAVTVCVIHVNTITLELFRISLSNLNHILTTLWSQKSSKPGDIGLDLQGQISLEISQFLVSIFF